MTGRNLEALFLDQSSDLIWIVDSQLQLTYANQAYLDLMKKVTGKEKKLFEPVLVEGFGEGYIEKWTNYYMKALTGEHFELEEHYFQPESNEIQYGQIIFNPICDENRHVIAVACQSRDITRIVKQRSEAHQLMDASLDVFCTINEAGNFVFVSKAATKHWGYTPQELIGTPYVSLILEEDIPKTNDIAESILGGEEIKSFTNRYKRKSGDIAFNQWSARWDSNTKLMYCVARDAKEKLEQENLLHQSEQRFKDLVQEGSDLIAILDAKGTYRYVSPTSVSILGIQPEEFVGRNPFEFIHPEDAERTLASLQNITDQYKVQVEPFRFKNKDHQWRWIETVLTNMLNNPAVNGIVANSRDITEKIKEQHQLKLLESVITNTKDAILITEAEPLDEPGPRIIYVNEAFTRMTGYSSEEVIGKSPRILQGPKSNRAELARLRKALRNWEPCEITTINYKKNGEEFWINFSVSPVADVNGWYTHWIAVERDVTEQKQKEIEIELLSKISVNFSFENDLFTSLNMLCKTVTNYGNFDFAELWLPNVENTRVNLVARDKTTSHADIFYTWCESIRSFDFGKGLPGKVWKEKKVVLWDKIGKKEDFIRKEAAEKANIISALGIPLLSNNNVVGVLVVASHLDAQYLNRFVNLFIQLEQFIGSEINRKKLENDLNHLYQAVPDILCLADFQGRFLKMNKAGCTLLGYSEEELVSHSFDEFVHPEDSNISANEVLRLGEGQTTFNFENRYITKTGEIIWLSWTCNSAMEEGLIYATAKNITEEKKLRELNRMSSKLAKIGSWEIDVIANKLFWSDMVYELHETDPKNFYPDLQTAINLYREDFRSMVTESVNNSIETGDPFDFEAVLVTLKKNERWIRAIGKAEMIDGKCHRIFGSFQDIHERKEANLRLHSLANNLPGVVFQYILSPDGTDSLKFVTNGANDIWEYSPEQVMENIDLVWNQTKSGGDYGKVKQDIMDSIATKTKWVSRYKSVSPSGKLRTLLGSGTPNFLADGTVLFNSLVLDISYEAKNEELLDKVSGIAKIGNWETDLLHGKHFKSKMVEEILELEPDQEIPDMESAVHFCREDFRDLLYSNFTECILEGKSFDSELVIMTAKNNEKWVRIIASPNMLNGNCIKIYGSLQDIHDRKINEIALQKSLKTLEDYKFSLDQSAIVAFTDSKGVISFVNDNFCKISQYSKEELIGNTHQIVNSKYHSKEFFVNLWKTISSGKVWRGEIKNAAKDGSFYWVDTTIVPFLDEKGKPAQYLAIRFDVTDRKLADENVLKTLNEKEKILESIGDAFFSVNNDWIVTYWNKEAEILLGKKREDIIGRHLWTEYVDAIDSDFYHQYHKAMKTGETVNFEEFYPALNKWFEVSAYPSHNSLSVYFKDVTLRKEADLRLLHANQEKTRILERITEAFVSIDTNWCYTYMNKQAGEIFNRDPESIIGKHIWTEFPEGLNQPFHHAYERAMATQEYIYLEEHYKPFGRWFENHIYPSPDGISIFFRDVTERKRSEEQLKLANERFEIVTEATNDAIWDWNISEGTFYRSSAIDKFFGKGTANYINEKGFWQDRFHPEDLPEIQKSITQALADPECNRWEREYRVFNDQNEIVHVIDRGIIIRDQKKKANRMLGAMTDITERKNFEQQLLELNESLKKHAHELELTNEELEQFAFIASHDLQEPLRMITSFMDQLKRKYENQMDEKALQYIHFAADGARRMKKIILDLLEYSRAGKFSDSMELVDLNEILSDYKLLRRKIINDKQVELKIDHLPAVKSFKTPLIQTFHCLLDNAIKYSKEHTPPLVEVSSQEFDSYWRIRVADNGIGIDPQFFDKIFIIFQRLHNRNQYEGTGIGLSLAKKQVESWGGKIEVESSINNGSTFYFTIPRI